MKKKAFKAAFPYTLPICVGLAFSGNVLWFYDAKQGIFLCISIMYELFYLCGVHGICYGKSAFVSI